MRQAGPLHVAFSIPLVATIAASNVALAQSSFDVRTIVSVPPKDDARAPGPGHPWNAPSGEITAAIAAPGFSGSRSIAGFAGAASPLACREAGYRIIIDDHSDLTLGTLCQMQDGSWQFVP